MTDHEQHLEEQEDDYDEEPFTPWDALAELIAKLQPEDARELTSIVTGFLERKASTQSRQKRSETIARLREAKLHAQLTSKFQTIRLYFCWPQSLL